MQDEYADFARLYAALLDPILQRSRRSVRAIIRNLGVSNVLDICCGTGALCRELASDGLNVTGVDLSDAMLAQASRRNSSSSPVQYLHADARELPFEADTFGVCTLSLCLHENDPHDRPLVLAEASRVARTLVLMDYTQNQGVFGALTHVPERIAGARHYAAFRDFMAHGGLEGLLQTEGFTVLARKSTLFGTGVCVACVPDSSREQ